MKRIKKLGKTAFATLLAGATITGASATLGDYPKPFIDDDGTVDTQIVVGESAKTVDVVGALNIAGTLGQDAYSTVSTAVGEASFGWSASGGETLDTRNDRLHYGDNLDEIRDTLTSQHLEALEDTEFRDDGGDETKIEFYLYPGSQKVQYGQPDDADDDDPMIHVQNPSDVSSSDRLFELQANMEDSIDFTSEDVQGEEIGLFGKTYTVSQDSTTSELILFGSQDEVSIDSGESSTITIDGEEHTFEVVAVTSGTTTAFRLDGELMEKDEDDTVNVDGQDVRVEDVIQTNSGNSQGTVNFAIGSEELKLENGGAVQDDDEDDVDGTQVVFNGDSSASDPVDSVSSISVHIGSEDDDSEYVAAGETFNHPLFENFKFSFEGLNPDAAEEGDPVEEVELSPSGDEDVTASFTDSSGETQSMDFIHYDGSDQQLADDDDDSIIAVEGDPVGEDEYFVSDAGDFSHVWEVQGFDTDAASSSSGDEATVDLQDALSGNTVEVDLDAATDVNGFSKSNNKEYAGTEVIDGQTYYFVLDTQASSDDSDHEIIMTWGTDADYDTTGGGSSGATTAFPTIETQNNGRLAFYDPGQNPSGLSLGTSLVDFQNNEFFVDSSTQSTEGSNGYGDGDQITRVINNHDGTLDSADGDGVDAFSSSARFYDKDSSGDYSAGDEIYQDDDGDNVYTSTGDVLADADGTSTTSFGGGSAASISAGDSLTAFDSSDDVYLIDTNNDGLQSSGNDDVVFKDGDDDGDASTGTVDVIINQSVTSTTTGSEITSSDSISYNDQDGDGTTGDGTYQLGQDIYVEENTAGLRTYSASADTQINAGEDGTFEMSAGGSDTNNDLDEATYFSIDVDNSGGINQGDEVVTEVEGDLSDGNTITAFSSTVKHSGSQPYSTSESVVDDTGSITDEYDSGDTLFGSSAGNVRYWSSDAEETNKVTEGLDSNLPGDPAAVFIEEEAEDDNQYSYIMTATWDGTDSEIDIDQPTFSDSAQRDTTSLESDDDVTGGYDVFGAYSEYDDDDQNSFSLFYPAGQSTVGAAFTDSGGELSSSGGAGSVDVNQPTGFPDAAALDSDISSVSGNTILVGGPAVNDLTKQLADNNKTWSGSDYSEGDQVLDLVEDAFGQNTALVVAGYSGADTRAAANYLSSYADHAEELAGKSTLNVGTQ